MTTTTTRIINLVWYDYETVVAAFDTDCDQEMKAFLDSDDCELGTTQVEMTTKSQPAPEPAAPPQDVHDHLAAIGRHFRAIQELDPRWVEPNGHHDRQAERLRIIEAGSTGIHWGHCDEVGDYWVYDGETCPSHPLLVQRLTKPETDA